MEPPLNIIEVRVLACLVEKSLATPEYYPLTLNALAAACSQRSNRNPVMQLPEKDILRALDALRARGLAWSVALAGSRVTKYRHGFDEAYPLTPPQLAVLCELMLRGPQTPGELRIHADRLCALAGVAEAQAILQQLMDWPGGALAAVTPRAPGQREERYTHLLGGPPAAALEDAPPAAGPAIPDMGTGGERLAALETKVAALEDELARQQAAFADFVRKFE